MFGLFKNKNKAKDNSMAKSNYDACLKIILHHEGGYVNHPKDGGETNLKSYKKSIRRMGW